MAAPGYSPFDGNVNASPPTSVGYRAGPSDFNGIGLVNDPVYPPDPATMPTAELLNTYSYLFISICKAIGVAGLGVNGGASPTVAFWWTAANQIASNPFVLTRNSAGDISVTWAANLFPIAGWPRARLNVVGGLGAHNYAISSVNITNGARVTTTLDGALTDLSFSLEVF